jgi:hypothetical protein
MLFDLGLDPTSSLPVVPPPPLQLTQMLGNYLAWYTDVHTVETTYVENTNGSGVLTGMDFLRTPGFGWYTFGIGVPHAYEGPIVSQAGVWNMSRTGNTVTAQFGDLILHGDIQNSDSCHSIAVSGSFGRQTASNAGPSRMKLALYIDGIAVQSAELEAVLQVDDPTVETIIGDPLNAANTSLLSPPIIMNTTLTSSSASTPQSFSERLCPSS